MGIPYTPTIPATNDDPGDDQPLMQQNFASINTWINVDHVGFSNASYGEHNQVTFANIQSPATPANPASILYTKNDTAGNPQLNFLNSAAFANIASSLGCVLVLGGIIIQWGSGALTSSQTNFATAFPNNCYSVVITGTSTLYTGGFVATSVTKSGFVASRTSGSGNTGFYFIAIGN